MVSFTTVVVWTLVRVSVPAFTGLVSEVSAKCALWFAPEDALGDVVVIAIADLAARLRVLRAKDPKVRCAQVCITMAGLVLQGIAGSEHWALDVLV